MMVIEPDWIDVALRSLVVNKFTVCAGNVWVI